ncbi:MAG TPA: single-stranded DNA-binding protein [Bryobacteraceae bacterium]|nr:single-stranded DNA-binding protein [Bryobacteraceae bacterium]
MNLNQHTIIGFIGRNAETKQLPNGTPVIKFSVATTRSWKDDRGEWRDKTQWHNVVAFGQGFAQIAARLAKGTQVFVQRRTRHSRVRPYDPSSERQEDDRARYSAACR